MKCPTCFSESNFSHEYVSDSRIFNSRKIFGCFGCQMHFADISQENLNQYYELSYDQSHNLRGREHPSPKKYFADEKLQFKPYRSKLHAKFIKKYLSKKNSNHINIIDFGAGFGTTLFHLNKNFLNSKIYAYENSKVCQNYLKFIDAHLLEGDPLDSLRWIDASFDVVVMSHFLEHLSAHILKEFIDLLAKKMTASSVLLIEVPNDNWFKFPDREHDSEPHSLFFSNVALRSFVEQQYDVKFLAAYTPSSPNEKLSIPMRVLLRIRKVIFGIPYYSSGGSLLMVARKL